MGNFFKIDSNVDLSYTNKEGNGKVVKDAIQLVSGTDGSSILTNSNGQIDDYTLVDDLTATTSISGRGILFNETGDIIAKKGNFVLRDDNGNIFSLDDIKYNNIKEDSLNKMYLRDQSLVDITNGNTNYISMDQLIDSAKQTVLSTGNGNIVQITNNKQINTTTSEIMTVPLSKENTVFIKCKVIVSQDAYITLSDTTDEENPIELSQTEITSKGSNNAYINYIGSLDHIEDDITYDTSKTTIYNSFYKRFFMSSRQEGDTYIKDAPHKLTLTSTVPFEIAYMNIIVSDKRNNELVKNGITVFKDQDRGNILFDNEFIDDDYIISSLESSSPVNLWWSNKSKSNFTINVDKPFTGYITWEAMSK